ncbi:MAG: alpha-amylase family glycosyl hydrolase [bacterium]
MKRILTLVLLTALLLTACAGKKTAAPVEEAQPPVAEAALDKTGQYTLSPSGEAVLTGYSIPEDTADEARVFYEIFVGSFSDSDGDGVGDLRGILNRMDYLNDGDPDSGLSLGVEGIWLTPIFKSNSYHKYDVNDYYAIDPAFGTEEDLAELIALCHARNVLVILDLPLNHTGKLNKWFSNFLLAQRKGETEDPYYNYYTWATADTLPAGRTFEKIAGAESWYECNFSGEMPELNFDAPAVREAAVDVARYWLERGVDGFRFDAAKYIYFGDNAASGAFWVWYLDELRAIKPDIYTVAEVWDADGVTDAYYPALNCFNFTVSQSNGLIAETAKAGNVNTYTNYVDAYLDRVRALRADALYLPFVANHDTDRAAGYLSVASGRMQMAANLYLLGPGSPFLYYGEELGMRGSRGSANTDANRRLAMRWDDGDTISDPEGTTYAADKQIADGVAAQKADGASLLSYYKRLLMLRKENPEIARGDYTSLNLPDTKLGGFTASYRGSTVCVLHNASGSAVTVDIAELGFSRLVGQIGMEEAELTGTSLRIGGQTSVVLR